MAKKYSKLNGNIKSLNVEEISAWLGGLDNNTIVRSILIAEVEAIRAGQPREMRTLRGLWYEIVKPILSRLGVLNELTANGKPIAWDSNLSERLGELVKGGFTSYEELKIIDGSRQRFKAQDVYTRLIDVSMVGGNYPWVILFTEKDTIWPVIQNLATLYGVSAISGGGQPANSCSENITREIIRSDQFRAGGPQEIILLELTDYDPAGYSIAKAQFDQIREAAANISAAEREGLERVKVLRLGLYPEQLTAEELTANAYDPKDKGLDKWLKETGGINGQPLGLELDSMPIPRLIEIFANEIEKHIDISKRIQDLKTAFIDLTACNILLPDFEKQRRTMIQAAKSSSAGQALNHVPVPKNLFIEAAKAGAGWISPAEVLDLFREYEADIKRAMQG